MKYRDNRLHFLTHSIGKVIVECSGDLIYSLHFERTIERGVSACWGVGEN